MHVGAVQAGLQFMVKVTNTGHSTGSKVVAAYISYTAGAVSDGPIKQLFAIEKVKLEAGETSTVSISSNQLKGYCSGVAMSSSLT